MKYLIIFILFFNYSFSQEYNFNNFYKYENNSGESLFFMTNNLDDDYLFYGFSNNNKIEGYVVDYVKNEYNYCKISEKDNKLKLVYESSRKSKIKFTDYSINKNIKYDYITETIDSVNKSTTILFKKVTKRKTKLLTKKAILYFNINEKRHFHNNHLMFFTKDLFKSEEQLKLANKLPKRMIFKYSKEITIDYKLIESIKINTSLSINKKDKIYQR